MQNENSAFVPVINHQRRNEPVWRRAGRSIAFRQ